MHFVVTLKRTEIISTGVVNEMVQVGAMIRKMRNQKKKLASVSVVLALFNCSSGE